MSIHAHFKQHCDIVCLKDFGISPLVEQNHLGPGPSLPSLSAIGPHSFGDLAAPPTHGKVSSFTLRIRTSTPRFWL